jgi:hypothetical protein
MLERHKTLMQSLPERTIINMMLKARQAAELSLQSNHAVHPRVGQLRSADPDRT